MRVQFTAQYNLTRSQYVHELFAEVFGTKFRGKEYGPPLVVICTAEQYTRFIVGRAQLAKKHATVQNSMSCMEAVIIGGSPCNMVDVSGDLT